MKWRYQPDGHRLLVWNDELEFVSVRRMIVCGLIPDEIRVIIYEANGMTYIVAGAVLRGWLDGRLED